MKKSLFGVVAAATLLFASCAKDEVQVAPAPEQAGDFTAVVVGSRAELNDKAVLWNDTDLLSIFTKTAHNRQYKVKQIEEGSRSATFEYVNYSGTDATPLTANYALYPYDPTATISGDQIKTTLAAEQTYNAAKIDLGNALMVAKSSDNTLTFMNAGALLCFKVSKQALPDSYTLQSIKVSSTNKALAGEVTIDLANDGKAVVADDGAKAVTLATINAEITTTEQAFYLALSETTFAEGDATVTFTFNEGEKTIALPPFTLSQNSIKNVVYEIKADDFTGSTGQYDEVWDGEKTSEPVLNSDGYYEIGTPAELAWFAGKPHENMVLTADINMGNNPMKNIITANKELLGNGHTIKNLKVIPAGSEGWTALFSNSGNGRGVTVKNLTLDNIQVEGKEYSAVVVGYAQGTVILENVKVLNSAVKATNKVGALVGFAENSGEVTISECLVQGTMVSTNVTNGEGQIAAVVGYIASKTTITNTKAIGNTVESHFSESSKAFGKFVGMYAANDPKVLTLTNCTEQGTTLVGLDDTARAYAADYDNQSLHNLVGARRSGYNGTITIDGMVLVAATNDAVKAAWQQGGTIALPAGTFDINVSPKAGAVIKGAGKDKTIINLSDLEYGVQGAIAFEDLTIKKGNSDYTGFAYTTTESYTNCKIEGVLFLYAENSTFTQCEFVQTGNQYNVWTYGVKYAEFDQCTFNTAGKALLIYNEGAGASNVTVTGCKFYATTGAKASAISNQNCAAIELDNYGGMAHTLTTSGNSYDGGDKFSGEWRIKRCLDGSPITVNGTEYNQLAIDGKLMTISGTIVTVEGE